MPHDHAVRRVRAARPVRTVRTRCAGCPPSAGRWLLAGLVPGRLPGRALRLPDPVARLLRPRRPVHRRGGRHVPLGAGAVGGVARSVRQPPRRGVPELLPRLRPGHVRDGHRRGDRRQDRPGVRGCEPAAVRHVDRAPFGPVHTAPEDGRRAAPAPGSTACAHGMPASCMTVHGPDDQQLGAPLCPAVLRHRVAGGLAVVGPGAVAPVHHRAAPRSGQDARGAGVPAGRGGLRAVRQGRRVPAARVGALPRPDPPRRPRRRRLRRTRPLDADGLARAVRAAVPPVGFSSPGSTTTTAARLCWGRQLDVRPVRPGQRTDDPTGPLTAGQVAGYLAKYATKAASDPRRQRRAARTSRRSSGRAASWPTEPTRRRDRVAVRAAGQVGTHARLPRPLLHQVPPLLDHPRRAAPSPARWQALAAQSREPASPSTWPTWKPACWPTTTRDHARGRALGLRRHGWQTDGDDALALAAAARAREYAQARAERRRAERQAA